MREIPVAVPVPCLALLLLSACGTDSGADPQPDPRGSIEVTLAISGHPPDPDGVLVSLDGGAGQAVLAGESHRFTDLTTGSHTVRTSDVAWHCDLAGEPERSVQVRANQTSQVPLTVSCRNIGALVVTTRTAGSAVDQDGYEAELAGQVTLPVTDDVAATWAELGPGPYQVSLSGVAGHCWIPGESATSVEVVAAESTYVSFGIACPPFHDHIAFGSSRDGARDLWVMRSDGTGMVNLTPGALEGNDPSWSTDGARIAFTGGPPDGIWIMAMDGSAPVWIGEGYSPQWSPDGQRILFVGGGTYVMNADGSNSTLVIEAYCESPQWSPAGLHVAFVSGQDCGEGDPGYLKSIYVANLDGTGKRRVTSGATELRYDKEPAWHPGTRIAFAGFGEGLGTSDIYTIEPDGSDLRRLTVATENGMYAYEPQWSFDGEWVVFSHNPDGEGRQICVVRADATGYECLTGGDYYSGYPSWSPSP